LLIDYFAMISCIKEGGVFTSIPPSFKWRMEIATISPPEGLVLYTMKAVAPHHSMGEIYKASIPFVIIDVIAMAIIMIFPDIALFLPSVAKR
jgi:TRAP-type mannitol/chloroaromatic compound transport system permease large subunit